MLIFADLGRCSVEWLRLCPGPMRPKARETTQHGSLTVWLEESDPARRALPEMDASEGVL
jgi:hypothetical protein